MASQSSSVSSSSSRSTEKAKVDIYKALVEMKSLTRQRRNQAEYELDDALEDDVASKSIVAELAEEEAKKWSDLHAWFMGMDEDKFDQLVDGVQSGRAGLKRKLDDLKKAYNKEAKKFADSVTKEDSD